MWKIIHLLFLIASILEVPNCYKRTPNLVRGFCVIRSSIWSKSIKRSFYIQVTMNFEHQLTSFISKRSTVITVIIINFVSSNAAVTKVAVVAKQLLQKIVWAKSEKVQSNEYSQLFWRKMKNNKQGYMLKNRWREMKSTTTGMGVTRKKSTKIGQPSNSHWAINRVTR